MGVCLLLFPCVRSPSHLAKFSSLSVGVELSLVKSVRTKPAILLLYLKGSYLSFRKTFNAINCKAITTSMPSYGLYAYFPPFATTSATISAITLNMRFFFL